MLTPAHITRAFDQLGLKAGDHLLIHSSLRNVGPIDGGPDMILDTFIKLLGPDGTLALPTFSYGAEPKPCFDPATTPSIVGLLTETFRKRPGVLRSESPTHSTAVHGKRAHEFTVDQLKTPSVGIGSPLDRIAQAGGWVMLLGVTHQANTTIHVAEAHARLKKFTWDGGPSPFWKVKTWSGEVIDHQLDTSGSCSTTFDVMAHPLRVRNAIRDAKIGRAFVFLMKGTDVIDATVDALKAQPDLLFCRSKDCAGCIRGRRHLVETGAIHEPFPAPTR